MTQENYSIHSKQPCTTIGTGTGNLNPRRPNNKTCNFSILVITVLILLSFDLGYFFSVFPFIIKIGQTELGMPL